MIGKRKRIRQQLRKGKKHNPDELASCYGKVRHTKESAKIELLSKPHFIKFYKCRYGQHYHIGRRKKH